jgi:hypothetical protein
MTSNRSGLFVYGSLIGTDQHGAARAYPARVEGLERGWYLPVPEDRDTGLAAITSTESACNGVVIPCDVESLSKNDARELLHGYERIRVEPTFDAVDLGGERTPKEVWAYVLQDPLPASRNLPIAQSYVDVVLLGALEISEDFAREVIRTTVGWDWPWIDDRKAPRYRRAGPAPILEIDHLLEGTIPSEFAKRLSA